MGFATIRDARAEDVPAILAIYNDVVATSTAIYRDLPTTLEERLNWFHDRVSHGFPVLVAEDDTPAILGFASFGDFRVGTGYRFTVEHSVHVHSGRRGGGIGAALMATLIERAIQAGKHVMVGGVDAANEQSIRFHERLGFERVGHLKQVGYKFDRWLDLVFLQRSLGQPL
jgi:L-amino acid N-acyltransferase